MYDLMTTLLKGSAIWAYLGQDYDFNTSACSRRALKALLSINVNNVCPIFSAWKGPYFVKLQLKILSLGKWHSYLWRSTYQNFSISQSVKAKSALVWQCISSDQKSHTIRHSWKRWWILARAKLIPESSPEYWRKYRVIFLTGPPLNLLSVGWNVTDFKKTLESQTGPP